MFKPGRVAIIGGSGQMGQWFAGYFKARGAQVTISARNASRCQRAARRLGVRCARNSREAMRGAELVIISVTVQNFARVVGEIGKYASKGQRVMDITSVKVMPVGVMHRHMRRATILGTHPMFGPLAKPEGQNFVLTPTNGAERRFASQLGAYLRASGFNVVVMTPKKHDAIIGRVLSLTHFVGFVTADTWKELGMHRLTGTSSTSFMFLRSFVNSIVDSSPELYSYLQANVPTAAKAEGMFVRKSMEWARMAKDKDEAALTRRMTGLRAYMRRLGR